MSTEILKKLPWFGLLVAVLTSPATTLYAVEVQFNRDIRPILSDRCFLCHGPDRSSEQASESDLRLDDRDSAMQYDVFNFDEASASELIRRVTSDDPDEVMPPPASHKPRLSEKEIDLIQSWISQGAKYQSHWAYQRVERPSVPEVATVDRVANPIDAFVLHQLESQNLAFAAAADRTTLIRRVTLDLTGLPPAAEDVAAFVHDPASTPNRDEEDAAYEKVVDQLLASQAYGENMAERWLDGARYADTSGYQYDFEREQWVWRDWVINAFTTNMPFDRFTVEQIAGDLLPDANDQTRLATGFNRNHPITIEGGVVDEEYRTEYVIDRVVTTSTVWMGQTLLCARCHDHKFDPISQKDFYQFYAFFNNVPEKGFMGFEPQEQITSPLAFDKIKQQQRKVAEIEAKFKALALPVEQWEKQLREQQPVWQTPKPSSITTSGPSEPKQFDDGSILMTGENPAVDDYDIVLPAQESDVRAVRLEAFTDPTLTDGSASRGSNGNFVLSEFVVEAAAAETPDKFVPVEITEAAADYQQNGYPVELAIDGKTNDQKGWAVDGNTKPENRTATFELKNAITAGSTIRIRMIQQYGMSHQIGRFRIAVSENRSDVSKIVPLLEVAADKRSADQQADLTSVLIDRFGSPDAVELGKQLAAARTELSELNSFPSTMVMKEMPQPREVYVLERGEYDKPRTGEPLHADVPSAMGAIPEGTPENRLGLAQWLISRDQPLTARVTVNRFWQHFFGVGLVKTSEDFGSQGDYPTHPELLDWLSAEFMETGWDVKRLLKLIVMSNTYRQSGDMTPATFAGDPENRLLARGPRFRLSGEAIRDSALAVSGLLEPTIGGASVYPYHPEGLWLEINNRPGYSKTYPHQTDLSQLHRRSMYTFWKRAVPPPSMATFDAPSREYCVVRRSRTNTPLQAFVMMHDPQFVEAARFLAARMMTDGKLNGNEPQVADQIAFGFRLCTSRNPTEQEQEVLTNAYQQWRQQYEADPEAAKKLLSVGLSHAHGDLDQAGLAAMTQIARMMMNLSEFITKS